MRSRARMIALAASLAALSALAAAPAAWATYSATSTLAPIGTGSYLLTVANTGTDPITGFIVSPGGAATNVVPNPGCTFGNVPFANAIQCTMTIAPGASGQMCYTGNALGDLFPGGAILLDPSSTFGSISSAPAVASCPVAGFNSPSSGPTTGGGSTTPGPSGTTGSGGAAHHKHKKHHKHHKHKKHHKHH